METVWFVLVALMLVGYSVFDGFDLGAGALHLIVARDEAERRMLLQSIGPVWDGNEVWLLAAGGTLFYAFPLLYASAFSGFYLPLMIVLWLLMLRAIAEIARHEGEDLKDVKTAMACLEVFAFADSRTARRGDVSYYATRAVTAKLTAEVVAVAVQQGSVDVVWRRHGLQVRPNLPALPKLLGTIGQAVDPSEKYQ